MSPETIPDLLDAAARRDPDGAWLRCPQGRPDGAGERVHTFAEAAARVGTYAAALAEAGVGPGTVTLATSRNTADYLFCWLAAMHLGALYCAVNPKGTADELAGFVAQLWPAVVVSDAELWPLLPDPGRDGPRRVDVADLADQADRAPDTPAPPSGATPTDPAILIPTSGTTGRSKLVTQTQRTYVMAGEGFPHWMRLTAQDRLMTSLPLFHVNAPAYSTLGSLAAGAGLVLLPRFSASGFLGSARRHGATQFNAIGAMLEMLMAAPARPDDADNPLRLCYTGPSPTEQRQREIEERFGLEIVCGYALSESPYGLIWPHGTRPFGTLGAPRQHPRLGTVNSARVRADGRDVGAEETGELELRNPTLMLGYHEMPEETAAVLVDGWLRTGDLVTDHGDGTYTFVGRRKEVIRRRGENLSPTEVEDALATHPGVGEVAVVGVPDALTEEEVKAFVVPAGAAVPDPRALRAHAAERVARYKVPRYVEVVAALPHTPTGRIAKHRLPRERTAAEFDAEADTGA